jgi:hypothetical protein
MLKIISDGYKAQSNDNYSSFTDFERSLALEIVWALVESRESQAVLAELGEMHNLICIRKILAPFDVDKQSHRPQDKQIRNDLALVLLRLASSTQFSATRSAYQSSQQLSSSKNIGGEKSRISLSRPSSSGAGNNNRPKSVTFASEKIDWLQVARAASDNIINSASNPSSHDAFIQSGLTEMLTERLRTDQCLSDTVKDPRQPNTVH